MRITVPVVVCDSCKRKDVEPTTESTIIKVQLPGQPELTFAGENCADCSAELTASLTALLTSHLRREDEKRVRVRQRRSAKADEASAAPKPAVASSSEAEPLEERTCPICERPSKTRSALGMHLRQRHGTSLNELGLAKPGGRRTLATAV